MVTPDWSWQGVFASQSFPAGPQRMCYSFSETSAGKCRWHDSVWSAAASCRFPWPEACFRQRLEQARDARAAASCRTPKKDVKLCGTNPISPLASTKVLKKRTQTKSKRSGKMCRKYAKRPKRTGKLTSQGKNRRTGTTTLQATAASAMNQRSFPALTSLRHTAHVANVDFLSYIGHATSRVHNDG